jgi:hypothetical protein
MDNDNAIVLKENFTLGAIQVAPEHVIHRAMVIAKSLVDIVEDRKLYSLISGKKHVRVEGWNTLGAMLGVLPRERSVIEHESGDFEATVDLVRISDGMVIGSGSALVGMDEKTWQGRNRFARRSMAVTRATGKAFRIGFSWIMALAGYEVTPAEEMTDVVEGQFSDQHQPDNPPAKKPSKPPAPPSERPYSPEILKTKIAQAGAAFPNAKQPNEKQVNLLRYGLELCFVGHEGEALEYRRHTVLHFLTGHESTKDVDGPTFKAIVEKWLEMKADSGGEYSVSDYAIQEAQMVFGAALQEAGQGELPLAGQ